MSEPGKNLSAATRSAKQEITEAGKFVTWLHEQHQIDLPDCCQVHIEDYLSSGPSTRHAIRIFIVWHLKAGTVSRLAVPHRNSEHKTLITHARRLELIYHCVNATGASKSSRVAGLILLPYAQPIIKIAGLKTTDLITRPDGLYLANGESPALIPEQISELFWDYLRDRPNQQTGNKNSPWLFPSTIAGQHIHVDSLKGKLRIIGIDPAAARNATLRASDSRTPAGPTRNR